MSRNNTLSSPAILILPQVFTILYQQDDIPALEVLNSAGKWVKALPIPETLVIK